MRWVSICTLFALVAACGGSSGAPEEELREWVAAAEAAAEDLDRRRLVAMVSERYADARGNDREAIDKLLRLYFLRQKSVALACSIEEMTVNAASAAEILLTVAGVGTTTRGIGINADAYVFSLELEKHDGDWLLIGARWGELGQELR